MSNLIGTIWNSTWNTIPIHWKSVVYSAVKIYKLLDLRNQNRFWTGLQIILLCSPSPLSGVYSRSDKTSYHQISWSPEDARLDRMLISLWNMTGILAALLSMCLWNISTLRWHHNDQAGVSNHQPHGCLLNRLFRRKSKKTSKLRVTGLCAGNSPGTGEFPAQMASYAENVSIWWRHHELEMSKPKSRGFETSRAPSKTSLHSVKRGLRSFLLTINGLSTMNLCMGCFLYHACWEKSNVYQMYS